MVKTPFLEKYTDNLSAKIAKKEADYEVYGRDEEIQNVITSLRRRTKITHSGWRSGRWEDCYCRRACFSHFKRSGAK